ncbi:lysine (K)-specific demethylase [Xylographa trunciseda]|nr:lysine (K)-specific demethylase [Xylographa trunciseda]
MAGSMNEENVVPLSRICRDSTGQDELETMSQDQNGNDLISSPTLSTPIEFYHEDLKTSQTEESEPLAQDDEEQDTVQNEVNVNAQQTFQDDLSMRFPARLTRAMKKKLENIVNGELPSPVKSPDYAEGSGDNSEGSEYKYVAPVETMEEVFDEDDTPISNTYMDTSVGFIGNFGRSKDHGSKHIVQDNPARETKNREAWADWHLRKADIKGLLVALRYGMPGSHNHEYDSIKVPALTELENHGIYSVEQRVCVVNFKYSECAFSDFARKFPLYLELLEEAAGRNCGVVKVILPSFFGETRQPTETLTSDQPLCTRRTRGVKNGATENIVTYEVSSIEKENVMYRGGVEFETPNSVKHGFEFQCKEREFLTRAQAACNMATSTMKTADESHMAGVRRALGLSTAELSLLAENTLKDGHAAGSTTDVVKIHVAQSEGVACEMRMNKGARYSISYLHKGAAKVWTVVKPFEHVKFEEVMHMITSPKLFKTPQGNRPQFPPQCDSFLGHKKLYVPGNTLDALEVDYRRVVQEQNEMIIIFPYAYHQVYDTGASVSEEMPYSNERSDIFLKKYLCRHCRPNCRPPLHLSSVQEGNGTLFTRRQEARKGVKPQNPIGRQPEVLAQVSKRKLEECDTLSEPMALKCSTKKKRTSRPSLSRGSGEDTRMLKMVGQEFANDYGKNQKYLG